MAFIERKCRDQTANFQFLLAVVLTDAASLAFNAFAQLHSSSISRFCETRSKMKWFWFSISHQPIVILAFLLYLYVIAPFLVVQQFYQTRVIDEFVLRGNAALLKCNLPSFVADFVSVEAWISDDGMEILPNDTNSGTLQSSTYRKSTRKFYMAEISISHPIQSTHNVSLLLLMLKSGTNCVLILNIFTSSFNWA